MKREIKHIRGLTKSLEALANEVERKGCFDKEDLKLLKKIGTDLLWKGVILDLRELVY